MAKINPNTPVTYKILMDAIEYVVDKLGEMMEKGFTEAAADRLEIKRQLNDLKADTPTQKEVDNLDKRVTRLESFHSH